MNKRVYNIMFHTHTVSGIVICVALYVIFFAGSFAFFRDEITNWERNEANAPRQGMELDVNRAIDRLSAKYDLYGRDITIQKYYDERRVNVTLSNTKDTTRVDARPGTFFYLDPETSSTSTYMESYGLGEFLYRLHFFAQIYYPVGYYLSGFVALFFLFTIITGVVIHWDKIKTNFYVFRPRAKLKTLWTDAHTVLGVIGLPFQFVYAVTGAFFMLKALAVAPSVFVLYGGEQAKMYEDLEYAEPARQFNGEALAAIPDLTQLFKETRNRWDDFQITKVFIANYGDTGMHVTIEGAQQYAQQLTGPGKVVYSALSEKTTVVKNPDVHVSYLDGVKNILFRLHYGDYGGYALKAVSFLLGIISCVVILSGVLIWLTARDKKNLPEKKRRFNNRVAYVFIAISLTMYPMTAAGFIAVKLGYSGMGFLYPFYFIGWLLLSLFFIFKKDNGFTTRTCLLLGSILGLAIPLVNGFVTGNWFWKTLGPATMDFFVLDVFWLLLAGVTFWVYFRLSPKKKA